jgi:transcriptional regulator GlxA family with amidase domain
MTDQATRTLGALLYEDFELLDLFGPLEMFGNMQGAMQVRTVADRTGLVRSAQGPRVHADHGLEDCPPLDLLLVPGGIGTRTEVDNARLLGWLRARSGELAFAMTVCTGSALLAAAGLLDGRRATTNKMFFAWPETTWPAVRWVREARWVEDGKFWTSSGVAAGIDMALAVVSRLAGQQTADLLATATEYEWHRDADWDPFARVHGLV